MARTPSSARWPSRTRGRPEKIVDFVKREMGKEQVAVPPRVQREVYSAEELSALIIKKLKNDAEKYWVSR
jgi:molecular chaperone DnaK (HSP70)